MSNINDATFVMIKPDGVARGLVGEIITRIERKGLRVACMKMCKPTLSEVQELYKQHEGKTYYEGLITSSLVGSVVVMAVVGLWAQDVMRKLIGATAGFNAEPGTIRGDFSNSQRSNLIHASSSALDAERELLIWFTPTELDYGIQRVQLINREWNYSTDELK